MRLKIKVTHTPGAYNYPWEAEVKGPWWSKHTFVVAVGNTRSDAIDRLQRKITEHKAKSTETMKVNW